MMDEIQRAEYEVKFLKALMDSVISKLSGRHQDYQSITLNRVPSREIIIGTLCPPPETQALIENKSSVKTSAISVGFLVKKFDKVKIKPTMKLFFGQKDTSVGEDGLPEKSLSKTWKRFDADREDVELSINSQIKALSFEDIREQIKKEFSAKENEIPKWQVELTLEILPYKQNDIEYQLVTVSIENQSKFEGMSKYQEPVIFDVGLEISLSEKIEPFMFNYEYEGFPEHYNLDIQCNNCTGTYDSENNRIKTEAAKIFVQEKIEPKIDLMCENGEIVALNFKDLANSDKRVEIFKKILVELKHYESRYALGRPQATDKNHRKYVELENNFKRVIERFNQGVETLSKDKQADLAFECVQRTFMKASKYPGWRLFQLVFIISCIPDIVKKQNFETAEVLHVNTGGGKSEAYFGLVLFTSFHDRLIGKTFGVSAITKFPLRMLSIQQLQRVANLFIWAEEIRKEKSINGDSFSVAYFVGSSKEFPRRNDEIIKSIQKEKIVGKIIANCPLCTKELLLGLDKNDQTIVHSCSTCNKNYQLWYTDEEVYRKLPTFIVGTVDKFAGVSGTRLFRNLFGGKLDLCPERHGFIPHGDVCEANGKKCGKEGKLLEASFNTGPSLIIQDEMHLIREGFGTIDSHFEVFLETLQKSFKNQGFKNIAMTATISGAENQIYQLYHKKVIIFPGNPPSGKGMNDFFFTLYPNTPQRLIIGLKPNVQENQFAIRQTYKHILSFIKSVEENKKEFCSRTDIPINLIDDILSNYKSYLSYHHKKDDVQTINYYQQHQSDENLSQSEEEYSLEPIVLTGEENLDNIRKLINRIETQNTIEAKKLLLVFATSIVSHGVDIEKWNVMTFQGMTRNTSEYIQALSRVGRKHVGLVFMWFYPNRIRDTSYYNKFKEYHEIIDHHVAQVPILRWAKLGFYQTFNSLFCATIINYFSNIENKPIYTVDAVNEVFSRSTNWKENRAKLIQFLRLAYLTVNKEAGSEFFDSQIPKEVEDRLNKLFTYKGGEPHFFPNALKESSNPYFKNQFGMRGIQTEVLLVPLHEQREFIDSYLDTGDFQ